MEPPEVIIKQEVDNFELGDKFEEKYESNWKDVKTETDFNNVVAIENQEYELDLPEKIKIDGGNNSDILDCLLVQPLSDQEVRSKNNKEMSRIGILENLGVATMAIENEQQYNVNDDEMESSVTKTTSGGALREYYTKIKGRKVASYNLRCKKVPLKTHLRTKHMKKYKSLVRQTTLPRIGRKADGRLQRQCGAKRAVKSIKKSPATFVKGHTKKYNTLLRHTTKTFGRQGRRKADGRLQRKCGVKKAVESTATAPATSVDGPSSPEALSREEKKTIDGMLLKMIAKTYQPITVVDEAGFRDFVRALNPNYEIPDKKTISEVYYPTIFDKLKAERDKLIEDEASDICLTIDNWTSKTRNRFMTVTAHFITKTFELKHVMFISAQITTGPQRNELNDPHALLQGVMQKMGHKITACVAEPVSSVPSIKQYGCLGHKLSLCLQRATIALKTTLQKVIKVFYLNRRYLAKMIEYHVKQLDIFSVVTWNYLYSLIEFVMKNPTVNRAKLPDLADEEWKALTQFVTIFKPFKQAMFELYSEKFVSASMAVAVITQLKTLLSDVVRSKPELYDSIKGVTKILQMEMDKQFGDIVNDDDLTLCAALDPRYKLDIFDADVRKRIYKSIVLNVARSLMAQELNRTTEADDGDQESVDTDVLDLWRHLKKSKRMREKASDHTKCHVLARHEVDTYFNDESGSKECDPCVWWKGNAAKYPNLSEMFRTCWQLRATCVPSKKVFFDDIKIEDRRDDLTAQELKMFVFFNANLEDGEDYTKYM